MSTPLIEIGHGWSDHPDASTAGREATRAAMTTIEHHTPSLITVHASVDMAVDALISAIRTTVGIADLPIIGATTDGAFRHHVCHDGVLVTVLASPHLRAHVGVGRQVESCWESAVTDALTTPGIQPFFENRPAHWRELTRRGSDVFGLVFTPAHAPGRPSRSFHILEALKARSQWQIPFVGGTATHAGSGAISHVFANGEVVEGGLAIAVIETELRFGIGLSHGFQATRHELEVTAADAHEIVSLDHRPALDVFAELTGHGSDHLMGRHLTLTTGHGFGHAGTMGLLQLNVAGFATERGGIQLTRPVAEGTRLRLLDVDRADQHFDTAADALRKAMLRAHHTRPAAAMMWYCAMRPHLLPPEAIANELSNAAQLLGDAPLLGGFSQGQHGIAQDGASTHFDGAVSVLLIGNELTPCALVARENEALRLELSAHSAVLERSHRELEQRVARRTQDLKDANERLRTELRERHRYEEAELSRARLVVQEAALRDHLRMQESLFDAIPIPVFHKDLEGRYTGCNEALAQFIGRPKDQIIGRSVFDLASEDMAAQHRYEDQQLMSGQHDSVSYECDQARSDGVIRQVVFNKARVSNAAGETVGIVGTMLDITERKAANAAREAALEEAQRLARVRRDFLSNMSHEIRSPLNVVLGLAQAGRRQSAGRKAETTFERILSSGQMLLALVNDILDFSRIESGKLVLLDEEVVLGEVIDQAVAVVARPAREKGLTLSVEEDPALPVRCRGDALRLAQVLVNLLFNAVKFTDAGDVRLIARREEGVLVLAVEDTGIGISEAQQARLFSAFEQAEATTTRRFGGSGLGLAITQRLVELMKGRIAVSSTPGHGSRFEVHVPLRTPDEAVPRAADVALVGLTPSELQALEVALGRHDIKVVPLEGHPDALVLVAPGAADHPQTLEAMNRGAPVAMLCAPGADDVPEQWRGGVIEYPVRARHVFDAMALRTNASRPAPVFGARLSGVRILAVEDAEMNRIVLEELLWDEGADLTLAEDGLKAIGLVEAQGAEAFDVVLTDIQMPGIDGYETARRLLALAPDLPIIGLTAHAMPEERQRCLAAGMVDHVTKPIELDVLIAAILAHADAAPTSAHTAMPTAPAAPRHAHAAGPVDWQALKACFPNKPDVIDRLASSFVRSHQFTRERLLKAIDHHDLVTLEQIAHSLKGTAGHLRARALRDAAENACNSARSAADDAISRADRLLDALEATLAEARAHTPSAD